MLAETLLLLSAAANPAGVLPAAPPCAAAPVQDGEDEIVRMRDGRVLVGEIVRHDLDGLEVVSALNGGQYSLSWSDLFPGEAERLKRSFGYRLETGVPEVSATRLLLQNGRQLTGRVVQQDTANIRLRTRDTEVTIPRTRLAAPPEPVSVPAPEVLTPEQFYAERLPVVDAERALAQYDFAVELQAVFALDQALERLGIARELAEADGDSALLRRIDGTRKSLELTIAHRAEAEALEDIRQLIHRERFAEAEQDLATFEDRFPDGGLRGEFLDMKDRFEEKRTESMESYLKRNWHSTVLALLKRKALDRTASIDQLIDYAVTETPQLVRQKMLEELKVMKDDLEEYEIDALWANRFKHSPKRHQAGFGNGTWILGEERASAGLETEDATEDDGKTPEQRELEDRMKRYLDNLEKARRAAGGGESGEQTPEEWWRRASPVERFQWLLAYYAEFAGDYEVTLVRFETCPTCAGAGSVAITEISGSGGQDKRRACPTCHKVRVRRGVSFR